MAVLFILPISWGILFGLVLAHSFELPKLSIFISLSLSLLTVPWLWFYKLNRDHNRNIFLRHLFGSYDLAQCADL
jgi:hypothetical protein